MASEKTDELSKIARLALVKSPTLGSRAESVRLKRHHPGGRLAKTHMNTQFVKVEVAIAV